jgi:hypothetical protein
MGTFLRATGVIAAATISALALGGAASAAQSPTSYRSNLNAMCRSATAELHQLKADMSRAQLAQDSRTVGVDLGKMIVIGLREDSIIEQMPVPTALKIDVTQAIRILKASDVVVHAAVADFAAGNAAGGLAQLKEAAKVGAPSDRYLDAAGLRDCGSNQG